MDYPKFYISGTVINAKTEEGIYNLRVEAWDKDPRYNDLVGVAQTNRYGKFMISFDLSYFSEHARETAPDLFFKVFKRKELLTSTEDSILWSASEKTEVTIPVNMPAERPEGKDRVNSQQIFTYANFIVKSDFSGLIDQTKAKVSRTKNFTRDIIKNAFEKTEIDPLRIKGPRMNEVLDQDVNVARSNLEAQQISVNEVKEYRPGLNRESIQDISSLPINLKAGQKVNLYQKDGKVRYYSIVRTKKLTDRELNEKIVEQEKDIGNLKEEIKRAKRNETKKNRQITDLQKTIESLQKGQHEIRELLKKRPDNRN